MSAEQNEVLRTLAHLADTLVVGYEVVDLLQLLVETCQQLFDSAAAGILLADSGGELSVVVSTDESNTFVDLLHLDGPALTSFQTGTVVSDVDLTASPLPFGASAATMGYASAYAVPLRLRETTIGTLLLLRTQTGTLSDEDATAARAFADVATIGILHERALRQSELVRDQLQHALSSRVIIEQAKGALAFSNGVTMTEAFDLLRGHARAHHLGIRQVAALVIARELTLP